jgi:myo-inositol-1-phosphate synthase
MSTPDTPAPQHTEPLGVWIFGARGSVAATTVAGAAAIGRGAADATGLVTARAPFDALGLAAPGAMVFGGHEIRGGSLVEEAEQLADGGGLPPAVLGVARDALAAADTRIRIGSSYAAGAAVRGLDGVEGRDGGETRTAATVVDSLRADLREFRASIPGGRVVAVNLCSTEAVVPGLERCTGAAALDTAIATNDETAGLSASVLYTYAALREGFPFVNFTPLPGTDVPALAEVAAEEGLPHAGKDGKTGETLLKTVLAPMFRDRNFEVLSWSGMNLLGNRDGAALRDPGANAAKVADKDAVLPDILGDGARGSLTRIDYQPSLGDWKTAWDLVHFQGFLGVAMQLQFTWQGCDSILAAPLVLDLIRLADLAARRGEAGALEHCAVFFKTPLGDPGHAFARQMTMLEEYARAARPAPRA